MKISDPHMYHTYMQFVSCLFENYAASRVHGGCSTVHSSTDAPSGRRPAVRTLLQGTCITPQSAKECCLLRHSRQAAHTRRQRLVDERERAVIVRETSTPSGRSCPVCVSTFFCPQTCITWMERSIPPRCWRDSGFRRRSRFTYL